MDSPIRGRARELTHKVEATVPMNIHNRFDVEVIDSRTGKIRQRAQAENVICTQLWTYMFSANPSDRAWNNYIHYGSGAGTPASTDTSLFTFLGYRTPATGDDVGTIDTANHVYSVRRKIQLSETTAVGNTITEVGIAKGTSSTTLCTHAMLKDANGNQISIVKTNTDIINIYATVYAHWSASYDTYLGVKKGGYLLGYCCGMTTVPADSCVLQGQNSDTETMAPTITCSPAAKTATAVFTRLGASSGNFSDGGFDNILLTNSCIFYINPAWYTPPTITGEAVGTGNGSTKDFATKFRDVSGLKVYVDGVEQSGITTTPGVPLTSACPWKNCKFRDVNGKLLPQTTGLSAHSLIETIEILENPQSTVCGITSLTFQDSTTNYPPVNVGASNDMSAWVPLASSALGAVTIDSVYQNYKYFKIEQINPSAYPSAHQSLAGMGINIPVNTNIHFVTAPASGAVITADYIPATIAKDANRVFDFSVTFNFGEYTS